MTRLIIGHTQLLLESCWAKNFSRNQQHPAGTSLPDISICQPNSMEGRYQYLKSPVRPVHFHRVSHKANNVSFSVSIVNLTRIIPKHFNAWTEFIQSVQSCPSPPVASKPISFSLSLHLSSFKAFDLSSWGFLTTTATKNLPVCFYYELQAKEEMNTTCFQQIAREYCTLETGSENSSQYKLLRLQTNAETSPSPKCVSF